ncbi:MAG: hypothetical protein J6A62_05775 [Oscillospiraceae bacterium]|nr:hypothetical protein [Oscillospiraceae bacterium]
MKKVLSLLLTLSILLGVCSMLSVSAADAGIKVGFGRHDFTPDYEVPLAGLTNSRNGSWPLTPEDRLLSTVVAIADGSGSTVLICTSDMTRINNDWIPELRAAMSKASGVPENSIHISATHTHSSVSAIGVCAKGTQFYNDYVAGFAKAAKEAVDDLSSVTVKVGSVDVPYLNNVRHYWRQNGHINGNNFVTSVGAGAWGYSVIEADREVQIIRFVREGKKDVLMLNWQAHPTTASCLTDYGTANKYSISADFIAYCRNYLEAKDGDCLVAYYSGASGNVAPYHQSATIRELEQENCPNDTTLHGARLAQYIMPALQNLKTIDVSGSVQSMQMIHKAIDGSGAAIVEYELNAVGVGKSIGFVTAQYEMVTEHGMYIKENSPFEITFVLYLCNGRGGYIPSLFVYDYPALIEGNPIAYEATICQVIKGTGEDFAQSMVNMLNVLYK